MSKRALRGERALPPSGALLDFQRSKLRLVGLGLVCAKLALVPVVFDHSSDVPFSVIKGLSSHALAYVLGGVLVGLVITYRRAALIWSPLHVPVAVFFIANAAATALAVDPLLALYGAHTRMIGLGTIADCVLLYLAIAVLVRTGRDVLALAASFVAGSAVVLAYEYLQFFGLDPLTWSVDSAARPFSTIGQTTNLAEYLTVVAVGAGAVAIFQGSLPKSARLLLVLYAALAVAGTVLTQTRSAVIGLVAGGALLAALTWTSHPDRRARVVTAVGMVAGGAALALLLFATPLGARILSTVETPVATEGDTGLRLESAADTRLAIYRIAFEMVRDRPILGVGPDNFLASLPGFRSDAEPAELQSNPTSSAHSWLAQVASTNGVLGLVAFVSIVAMGLALTIRAGFRPESWASLAMLAAFLGAGSTTVNAVATDWLFWAATGVIASTTGQRNSSGVVALPKTPSLRSRRESRSLPRSGGITHSVIAFAPVALGLVLALTTTSAIDASRSAKASQLARLRGQTQLAVDSGLRATRQDSLRAQYWDTLGLAYVSADHLSEAVTAFDRASKLAPYDVRYDGDLARAFAAQVLRGDKAAAVPAREVANRVVRTDPNNPLAHQTRALVLQAVGDFEDAMASAGRALAIDGGLSNTAFYVTATQIYISAGRATEAVVVARRGLTFLGGTPASVPLRYELARALVASNQPSVALAELDSALSIQPGYVPAQRLRAELLGAIQQ